MTAPRRGAGHAVHEAAGGEIALWLDAGVVCLKAMNPHGDPVELNEHEAAELAALLLRLAREGRDA